MAKLWCGSSARAPKEGDKPLLRAWLALLALLQLTGAWAVELTELPLKALARPESTQVQVGDAVELPVTEWDGTQGPYTFAVPEGSSKLDELGWHVEAKNQASTLIARVAALKPGKISLPPLLILDAQGKPVARTDAIPFDVESVVDAKDPEAQKLVDPRPPVRLGFPWLPAILTALVILALLAWVGIVFFRWYRRRQGPLVLPEVPAAPPRPEADEALEALELLERGRWMEEGKYKAFYFRLSEIFKKYLGRRFEIEALESTTEELVARLDKLEGRLEQIESIERTFREMDIVKFTDHVPQSAEARALLHEIKMLIAQTRRKEIRAV